MYPDVVPRKGGFTLMEVLVALALIASFAAVFDPLLFQARHILFRGNGQIRAQMLLRSLLETSFDRFDPHTGISEGENAGMRWSVSVEPFTPEGESFEPQPQAQNQNPGPNWTLFRVSAHVFWGAHQEIMGESLKLGTASNDANL
jgi:prepilin-type N-terminal cleavage/methylation domain-containing protein